jgi:membrane protease YdiL (CAAX protease family)
LGAASAYALVHLPTMNLPLILTALIGGLVWGYIYEQTRTLWPTIISHVLFDLLIFVIAPFT